MRDPLRPLAAAVEDKNRELARAAEELRAERDRLDTVIHSLDDSLFILDPEGRVTLANPAARDLVDELGKGFYGHSPETCATTGRSCFDCLADARNVRTCEVQVAGRSYEIRVNTLRGGDGAERVFVGRDVTERKRQTERQAHQERLAVLGEVAAVMAHEMNNPLAAISMFSQMLLDELPADSPLYAHAEIIHRNMTSCKRTVRSLLDMAATSPSEPRDFDVRDLADDVVELLRPVAGKGGTALDVGAEAADGRLRGDEHQLRQAVVNLVMNALQATAGRDRGEVSVGTADGDDEVVIRVGDNGPGIPEGLRERIFEPFFTTKPPGAGTGLGLPTTRRIVEAMGGRLTLGTGPSGTTFEIALPRRPTREEAP